MRKIGQKLKLKELNVLDVVHIPYMNFPYMNCVDCMVFDKTESLIYFISNINNEAPREKFALSVNEELECTYKGRMEMKQNEPITIDDVEIGKQFLFEVEGEQVRFMKTDMVTNIKENREIIYKMFHCVEMETGKLKWIKEGKSIIEILP